jgi:hypothetical protein
MKIILASLVATAVAGLALLDASPAGAHAGNTDPNVIHGCVSSSGIVKIVGVTGTCNTPDIAVHWADLSTVSGLQGALAALQTKLAAAEASLNSLLTYIKVQTGDINGVGGPHVIVEGANFHVRSGSGQTDDTTNLGNLFVGYNDPRCVVFGCSETTTSNRTGSHNLVIGPQHQYTASGGLVAGLGNTVSTDFASVSGGSANTASGSSASVSGGIFNTASGNFASVSGGQSNTASGGVASVSGGQFNTASGVVASVSGGRSNTASGAGATVSGGQLNTASGVDASVSGGHFNRASGSAASVSGGQSHLAAGANDWVAGSLFEDE